MSTLHRSTTANARLRATILVVAPAVTAAGHAYHPWIGTPGDDGFFATLAAAIAAEPTRWWVAHLGIAVASGLLILAFLALHGRLREAGEDRWSAAGIPFIVMGSTLYALLPAMEFAPLAAVRAGADAAAVQASLFPWLVPILLTSAALFAVGVLGFVVGIARAAILSPASLWVVVAALLVMAAARFFPVGPVQLYVGPLAGIVALWGLAYAIGIQPRSQPGERAQRPAQDLQHLAAR